MALRRSSVDKLSALRTLMKQFKLHAYVVPTSDAHNSEYVSEHDKRRSFISGFTGSAGTAVVTESEVSSRLNGHEFTRSCAVGEATLFCEFRLNAQALLWTDGRYFLQANMQLDATAGWVLMKDRLKETPTIEDWLAASLATPAASRVAAAGEVSQAPKIVGVDPRLFPVASVRRLQTALKKKGVGLFTGMHSNLVDAVWGDEQPAIPRQPVAVHPVSLSGASHDDKLAKVRAALKADGCSALVVTMLDEIAWLFNIRGSDVECNPVTIAYAVVTMDSATLCIDKAKLSPGVLSHLGSSVTVAPYESIFEIVSGIPGKIMLDASTCNYAVYEAVLSGSANALNEKASLMSTPYGSGPVVARRPADGITKIQLPYGVAYIHSPDSKLVPADAENRVLEKASPLQLMKSLKTGVELKGMRDAHVRDGAALVTFLSWLETAVRSGKDARTGKPLDFKLTEFSVGEVLDEMRSKAKDNVSLSFETIAGFGPNGAIIHYRAEKETAAAIDASNIFLLDSGGQYRDGTTDVTRTVHFGSPTQRQKMCYTAVLQGHIGMSSARFPPGVSGIAIDALARAPLWQLGLDYRHGTGHGVGAYLNVHEGPQYVANATRSAYDGGLQEGMTITDGGLYGVAAVRSPKWRPGSWHFINCAFT